MTIDLAAVLRALQEATGFHVVNGQFTLHIADGVVQKVETVSVQRVPAAKPSVKRCDINSDTCLTARADVAHITRT